MRDIIVLAKERADLFDVRNVVVSTNTGSTANRVLEVFGLDCSIYAVGNPSSSHDRGLVHHAGISEKTKQDLESKGIKVILRDQSLFQAMDSGGQRFTVGDKKLFLKGCFHGTPFDEVIEKTSLDNEFNAVAIVYNTLCLFSTARVCIEVALMAADSDQLPLDADCISIACPSWTRELPAAAVVLRPAKTRDLFKREFRVKDIALVPQSEDRWLAMGENSRRAGRLLCLLVTPSTL